MLKIEHFVYCGFSDSRKPANYTCPDEKVLHPSGRSSPHLQSGQFVRILQAFGKLDTDLFAEI
jgi:hypothetical protein